MNAFSVENLCQTSRLRLEDRLKRVVHDEDGCEIYSEGFDEFCQKLLPALQRLADREGMTAPGYVAARQALLQHLAWLTSSCRRTCPDFPACAQVFTRQQAGCDDSLVKSALQRLGDSAATARERAAQTREQEASAAGHEAQRTYPRALVGVLLVCVLAIAGRYWSQAPQDAPPEATPGATPAAARQVLPAPPAPEPTATPEDAPRPAAATKLPLTDQPGIYRYTDSQGKPHFVKSLQQVPVEYRATVSFTPAQLPYTPVLISNNQVLVPVELRSGAITMNTHLLLDTGASSTVVSEQLAARLQLYDQPLRSGVSRLADGREVEVQIAGIDQLAVGSVSQTALEVVILPGAGDMVTHEGLLGMNFLQQHPYELDLENAVIRWK